MDTKAEHEDNPPVSSVKDKGFISFLDDNPLLRKIDAARKKKVMENKSVKKNDTDFLKALETAYEQFGINEDERRLKQQQEEILAAKNEKANAAGATSGRDAIDGGADDDRQAYDLRGGEQPDEEEIGEEYYQKYLDEYRNQISTALEKELMRQAATHQAKLFCMQFEMQERGKKIQDLQTEKNTLTKQMQEMLKDKSILEANQKKQEQKIMKLEKSHRENEELYQTVKQLLAINITQIEENAINRVKKLFLSNSSAHDAHGGAGGSGTGGGAGGAPEHDDLRPKSSAVHSKNKSKTVIGMIRARPPTAAPALQGQKNPTMIIPHAEDTPAGAKGAPTPLRSQNSGSRNNTMIGTSASKAQLPPVKKTDRKASQGGVY